MTGRHSGLGWPGAIGDQAREATAAPYIGRHRIWHPEMGGSPMPPTSTERYAQIARDLNLCGCEWCEGHPVDPRRCEDCGHLEDSCGCPHDCTYPEDTNG